MLPPAADEPRGRSPQGSPLLITLIGGVVYLRKRLSIPPDIFVKAFAGILIFGLAAAPGDILVNYISGNAHIIQTAAEEFCEMVGVTLILWAAMSLLAEPRPIIAGEALVLAQTKAPERSSEARDLPAAAHGRGRVAMRAPTPAHRPPN